VLGWLISTCWPGAARNLDGLTLHTLRRLR